MITYRIRLSRAMHVVGDQVCDTYTVHHPETQELVRTITVACHPFPEVYNKALKKQLAEFPQFTFDDSEQEDQP